MRPSPALIAAAIAAGLSVSACTAAPPADGAPAPAAKPAPAPSAKIAPEMVGKVSPIPAFMGAGKDWRIEIQSLDATQHSVTVHWPQTDETASGTATYRDALDAPRGAALALDGKLQLGAAVKALRLRIETARCQGADGADHPQRIEVEIEGRPSMSGCGDLAVY